MSFGQNEWLVDEIKGHRWSGRKIEFEVQWNYGDNTWEPFEICKDLIALDNYLDRIGVAELDDVGEDVRRALRAVEDDGGVDARLEGRAVGAQVALGHQVAVDGAGADLGEVGVVLFGRLEYDLYWSALLGRV